MSSIGRKGGSRLFLHTRRHSFPLVIDEADLNRMALRWRDLVANRGRWRFGEKEMAALEGQAKADLERMGIFDTQLRTLAGSGDATVVEVSMPFEEERRDWAARILPWEHLLYAATRGLRAGRSLTVVRHLVRPARWRNPRSSRRENADFVFVASQPGALRKESLAAERKLAEAALRPRKSLSIDTPSLDELRKTLETAAPRVVHLAGFDTYEGLRLLERVDPMATDETRLLDGFYLRDELGEAVSVPAEELAHVLAAGRPALVSCNFFHSAARVAALIVAFGAEAAIGFQDERDEALGEQLFAGLYRRLQASKGDLLASFTETLGALRTSDELRGTVVTLWSERSLVGARTEAAPRSQRLAIGRPAAVSHRRVPLEEGLALEVVPVKELNYSALHNGAGLFKSFRIRKLAPLPQDAASAIDVEVVLHAGEQEFPYRQRLSLRDVDVADLGAQVTVPLTSQLYRSLRESVQSCLYVRVSAAGTKLYERTHPVRLLAVDEWQDDPVGGPWLPSFVLSRDPAVARVIDAARRYLVALADDLSAGFDGYQSEDDGGADRQARAIWYALIHDQTIGYINPPSTFTQSSQRLRSPSEVLLTRAGTCIDTSLLLAACFEAIGLYPVVFLLNDHAFPGYWRTADAASDFLISAGERAQLDSMQDRRYPWRIEKSRFGDLVSLVRDDKLAVVESTYLTSRDTFSAALDAAAGNLGDEARFNSMIDIQIARTNGVTPLPERIDRAEWR